MFDAFRRLTLRILRVPAEPHPPAGAPGSIRVFRAGTNFFRLKVCGWVVAQMGALAATLVSIWLVGGFVERVRQAKNAPDVFPAAVVVTANGPSLSAPLTNASPETVYPKTGSTATPLKAGQANPRRPVGRVPKKFAKTVPDWALVLALLLEAGGVVIYLLQIPWTFAALRLDYEMRWYIVTDRSLRIRSGLLAVQESTLSFVNIQHVVVTQDPLQRLLGLSDVRVQSAGGGGGDPHGKRRSESLHTAVFHAVDNATEIRELILARLRQFRSSGLGDPDDHTVRVAASDTSVSVPVSPALAAAQELLDEARKLRGAI